MKLKEANTKRLIGLFDSHYPHTIDIRPLLKYLKARPPQHFILGGDNLSLDCISHWNDENFKNIGFNNIRETLREEIAGFRDQLVQFREVMPKTEITWILGNHEAWMDQFCKKYPQMSDMSLRSFVNVEPLGVKIIPQGRYFKVGKLYLCHGDQFGTENPAKQALLRTHKSIAMGHHHNQIMWSDFSDIDAKEKHIGIVVPCYAGLAPGYGKGRPNRWINGFLEAPIMDNGYFFPFIQHVKQDGTFVSQDGQTWA